MTRYVALLRGINVGGRNLIRMADLRACFEASGYLDVLTYIQSGNVVFDADDLPSEELARRVEAMLEASFDYGATVAFRTRDEMRAIVEAAPAGFGNDPARYRYDVVYLIPPLTAPDAIRDVPAREGVDEVRAGDGVLYFWRLISRASQSRLSRIVSLPIYQRLTIRNWNTTVKLLELMG